VANQFTWTSGELDVYEKISHKKWSDKHILEDALQLGLEKGLEKGERLGLEKGIKKGLEKALALLVANGILEQEAKKMLAI